MAVVSELDTKARVDEILHRRPAVGFALGVVRDGELADFHAHGLADVASGTPVTEDTVFRIASVTKTFTAIAVMQLWERRLIDLDAPAGEYLRAYRLVPARAGDPPATVRQLLTHTAGVPQMVHPSQALASGWFGESVALDEPAPTLAEYYRGALRLAVEPGSTFTYSDHGYATLGQIVEDVSAMPLDRYFRERVFAPLGMADTDLARSERVTSRLATGYRLGRHGPEPVTDRRWITAAASSVYATPRDMARYLASLLAGGTGEHGTVLEPATIAAMLEPHYQPDPRVPGFGLGFFRVDLGGHRAVEHQGILPGFNAQVLVAPDDGVAVMAFTNGAAGALMWLPAEAGRLLGDLLGAGDVGIRTGVPQRPEVWGEVCGWYRPRAQPTDLQARSMLGAGVEVLVRGGRLLLRVLTPVPALYRGLPLHPDDREDPYAFRVDLSGFGLGTARVVLGRDAGGEATSLHLDLAPLSLDRRPAARNPRRWATAALGALGAAALAGAVRRGSGDGGRRAGR